MLARVQLEHQFQPAGDTMEREHRRHLLLDGVCRQVQTQTSAPMRRAQGQQHATAQGIPHALIGPNWLTNAAGNCDTRSAVSAAGLTLNPTKSFAALPAAK